MTQLSVTVVQRGLAVFALSGEGQRNRVSGPGRIDGDWGPLTHESLRGFVATVASTFGLDAARVLAPLRDLPVGTRTLDLPPGIANHLDQFARAWRPLIESAHVPVLTPDDAPPLMQRQAPRSTWPYVLGGAVIVFGLGWWAWARLR